MALKLPGGTSELFKGSHSIGEKEFRVTDTQIKTTSGTPTEGFKEGTLMVNTAEARLYVRVPASADVPSALYYKLNASTGTSVTDFSGNGHTGTASGAAWTTGKYNNGFDTSAEEIVVPGDSDLDMAGDFTVEMWIKLNTIPAGEQGFFTRIAGNAVATNVECYILESNGGSLVWWMHDGIAQTNLNLGTLIDLFTTGIWYHIAILRTGTEIRFYLNGELKKTGTNSRVVALPDTDTLNIGSFPTGAAHVNMIVDEFKFWKSARTQTQIIQDSLAPDDLTWVYTQLKA